jgi:hypothetical protein
MPTQVTPALAVHPEPSCFWGKKMLAKPSSDHLCSLGVLGLGGTEWKTEIEHHCDCSQVCFLTFPTYKVDPEQPLRFEVINSNKRG